MAARKALRSDIAWATPEAIFVKGHDLCQDLLGKVSLGDMTFLQLMDRFPNPAEAVVFDALTIALMEHGMTPSALAARLTLAGAPDAIQAAVAAGLCGLGSVFVGSTEAAARMLQEALAAAPGGTQAVAANIVQTELAAGRRIPGLGHHFHKPVDPRAVRLFEIAEENGLSGRYVELMKEIALASSRATGKNLPINATGAIAAVASELGMPWQTVPALGIIARTVGLVAHIREERANPLAREIKTRVEEEAMAHLRAQHHKAGMAADGQPPGSPAS